MKQVEIQINTPEHKLAYLVERLMKMRFWVRFLVLSYLGTVIVSDCFEYIMYAQRGDESEFLAILSIIFNVGLVIPWQLVKVYL